MREFLDDDGKVLQTLPEDVDGDRYCAARDGDHLMVPFQCETCHYRNIRGRDPNPCNPWHLRTLHKLRRCNLDACWGHGPRTVSGNLREARRGLESSNGNGFPPATPPMGPFPLTDSLGMNAAMTVLGRS